MLLLAYMLAVTVLCIVFHSRKARPSVLFAIGLLGVIGGACLIHFHLKQGPSGIAWLSLSSSALFQANQDTYYVVYTPASRTWILAGVAILCLPLWLWLLESWGAMTEPALIRLLFWPVMAFLFYQPGVLFLIGFSTARPSEVLMKKLSMISTGIGLIALTLLALLLSWCILRKLRG